MSSSIPTDIFKLANYICRFQKLELKQAKDNLARSYDRESDRDRQEVIAKYIAANAAFKACINNVIDEYD